MYPQKCLYTFLKYIKTYHTIYNFTFSLKTFKVFNYFFVYLSYTWWMYSLILLRDTTTLRVQSLIRLDFRVHVGLFKQRKWMVNLDCSRRNQTKCKSCHLFWWYFSWRCSKRLFQSHCDLMVCVISSERKLNIDFKKKRNSMKHTHKINTNIENYISHILY